MIKMEFQLKSFLVLFSGSASWHRWQCFWLLPCHKMQYFVFKALALNDIFQCWKIISLNFVYGSMLWLSAETFWRKTNEPRAFPVLLLKADRRILIEADKSVSVQGQMIKSQKKWKLILPDLKVCTSIYFTLKKRIQLKKHNLQVIVY